MTRRCDALVETDQRAAPEEPGEHRCVRRAVGGTRLCVMHARVGARARDWPDGDAPYAPRLVQRFRPRAAPARAHPLVKLAVRAANEQEATLTELERAAGVSRKTVAAWTTRNGPLLSSIEAVLNYLGYELVAAPVAQAQAEPDAASADAEQLRAEIEELKMQLQRRRVTLSRMTEREVPGVEALRAEVVALRRKLKAGDGDANILRREIARRYQAVYELRLAAGVSHKRPHKLQ